MTKGVIMYRFKIIIFVIMFLMIVSNIFGQEITEPHSENWFLRNFNQRVYFGYYNSYFDDNINLLHVNTASGKTTGSIANIGSHVGLGMEYQINEKLKGYTTLRLFHASNGKKYEDNPALDAVGIIMGIQF